jgi:hypothetical protein
VYDDYGPGAHTWAYWNAALAATLERIVGVARERRPVPATVEHLAYEPRFSVWGHDVALDREELAPIVLKIGADGCALRGDLACRGRITTPAGEVVEVEVRSGA